MRILFTIITLLNALTIYASDGTGLIVGTVRALTGKEISGVTVKLLVVNQICSEKEMLTDEKGQFFFSDLPVGRYRVSVSKDGFVREFYGESMENPIGQELLITSATSQQEIDFHLVASAAVSGHVYDSEGNSMARSAVILETVTTDNRSFRTFADDLGYFYLADLPDGFYKISARKYNPLKKQTEGERWYYPGTVEEENIHAVELQAEKTTVIDIRFGTPPRPVWTGKVVGPDGEAIPNADLGFLRLKDSRLMPLAACRTTNDGTCSVRKLTPGNYWVYVARAPEPYTTWMRKDATEKTVEKFAKTLLIEPEKQASTVFELQKGIPVQAKIYAGNGAPAAVPTGIKVTLTHSWNISNYKLPLNASSLQATADTLKFFVHLSLPYQFQVEQQDTQADFTVVKVQWNRSPLTNPIQFSEDSTAELEIWVDQGSIISGVAPAAKVIFAERLDKDFESANFYSPSLFYANVQQGNFLLRALPPGTYRIRQNKKNGPFIEVTVGPGESKTVSLE